MGYGDAVTLARKLKTALALIPPPEQVAPAPLDPAQDAVWADVERILRRRGKRTGSLLLVSVPRKHPVREHGIEVAPAMGMASAIHFRSAGERFVAACDLLVGPTELNPVVESLLPAGIQVTALHNHTISETPRLFSIHFWAPGDPRERAASIRRLLERTDSF
jgi:Domain of Unknown Function (DUF1259)